MDKSFQGKKKWLAKQKLSEGDAGEVYTVSLNDTSFESSEAIAKCPKDNPVYAIRQATQIKLEGEILAVLQKSQVHSDHYSIKTTNLLDSALATEKRPEKFFIVIDKAAGISLDKLHKIIQGGIRPKDLQTLSKSDLLLAKNVAELKHVPDFVILSSIDGIIRLLDFAHSHKTIIAESEKSGIVWNDPKPNHVFWSCADKSVTVIDWGNGNFLEKDGVTADRETNADKDFMQFLVEFGRFLNEISPSLFHELAWNLAPELETVDSSMRVLRDTLETALAKRANEIQILQEKERRILQSENFSSASTEKLHQTHKEIVAQGLIPDFASAESHYFKAIISFAKEWKFSECEHLLKKINGQPLDEMDRWVLIEKILNYRSKSHQNEIAFSKGIVAVCEQKWSDIMWNLAEQPHTKDFTDIAKDVRKLAFGIEKNIHFPFEALVEVRKNLEKDSPQTEIIKTIINAWRANPRELDKAEDVVVVVDFTNSYLKDLQSLLNFQPASSEAKTLIRSYEQPKIQILAFKDRWQNRDFEGAQQVLRRIFIMDPDRLRTPWASEILVDAQNWLFEFKNLKKENIKQHDSESLFKNVINSLRQIGKTRDNRHEEKPVDLVARGKIYQNIFGEADWLDRRIKALELFSSGIVAEKNLALLLESDTELWDEFKILVGPEFIERTKKKDAESLSMSLSQKLDEYYEQLKRWNSSGVKNILSDPLLNEWKEKYDDLFKAIEGSFNGIYKNIDNSGFPPEDKQSAKAIETIQIIETWNKLLFYDGFAQSGKHLDAYWSSYKDWSNVIETKRKQNELNDYSIFFEHLEKKQWDTSLAWLRKIGVSENSELINALDFMAALFAELTTSFKKWDASRFTDIAHASSLIMKNFDTWLGSQRKNQSGNIFLAADWKMLTDLLKTINDISNQLAGEKISHWGFKKDDMEKAKTYLNKAKVFESAITGKTERSDEWLKIADLIIHEKKSPEIAKLKDTHPLYKWLNDYYESTRPIINWSTILRGATVAVSAIVAFGIFFGGSLLLIKKASTLTHIPVTIHQSTEPVINTEPPTAEPINPPQEETLPPSLEPSIPSDPMELCNRFAEYYNQHAWSRYKDVLSKLGENEYEKVRQVCGYHYSYQQKLLDVKLNELKQQGAIAENREEIRQLKSNLRRLLEENDISVDALENIPNERLSAFLSLYLDDYISWLQYGIAFCTVHEGIPLADDMPARNNSLSLFNSYLDRYMQKYKNGRGTLEDICQLGHEEIRGTEYSLRPENKVDLLNGWQGWTKDSAPCLYSTPDKDRTFYHFLPISSNQCQVPGVPTILNNQFAHLEAHLCILESESTAPFAYGLILNNNSLSLDNNTPEFVLSPNGTNPGCDSRQYVDIKSSRAGNLLLWQAQITDLRKNEPQFIPADSPYSWIEIMPDELGNARLNISFWGFPSEKLHILVNELYLFTTGGLQ